MYDNSLTLIMLDTITKAIGVELVVFVRRSKVDLLLVTGTLRGGRGDSPIRRFVRILRDGTGGGRNASRDDDVL